LAEGLQSSAALSELLLAHNNINDKGAGYLAEALKAQRFGTFVPVAQSSGEPGCLTLLDLSRNPLGNLGAEALAQAASVAAEDRLARTFQAPWGLEQLKLQDTRVGNRGRSALCSAIAARAALLDRSLQSLKGDEADNTRNALGAMNARIPDGFRVQGLVLDDTAAVKMRDDAAKELKGLWPQKGHLRKLMKMIDPGARAGCGQVNNDDEGCAEMNLQDADVDEVYFPIDLLAEDARLDPLNTLPASASEVENSWKLCLARLATPGGAEENRAAELPMAAGAVPPNSKGKGKASKGAGDVPPGSPSKKGGAPPSEKGSPKGEKGKGEGKGKGPPPPKGKAGKAPPPKGKASALAAKAKAGAEKAQEVTPFGRRIHWVQPMYEEPGTETIFGELMKFDDDDDEEKETQEDGPDGLKFDHSLLTAMFGGDGESDSKGRIKRRSTAKKPEGITVLNGSRAQNMAITLSQLSLSSQELCECLRDLDFSDPRLTTDFVELLLPVMPTTEETKKLLEHKEAVSSLRDIEQKVMPFALLERGEQKLNLMKTFLSHKPTYEEKRSRLKVLSSAAEEVMNSKGLKKVIQIVLKICNYINHGAKDLRTKGTARGFAIESLLTLPSFKKGGMSTMHFICLTMRSADSRSFEVMKQSLKHVHKASREKTSALQSGVEAFKNELELARRQSRLLKDDDNASAQERLAGLVETMEKERDELEGELQKALKLGADAQRYFGIHPHKSLGMPPCEQFFGHLAAFMDELESAWLEIERRPGTWKKFMPAGEKNGDIPSSKLPGSRAGTTLTRAESAPSVRPSRGTPATTSEVDVTSPTAEANGRQSGSLRRLRTFTTSGATEVEAMDKKSYTIGHPEHVFR
jgi:hypothetical protein